MTIITGLSPANAPGFSYDGRHSSEYGIYLLRSKFRVMPETRDRYETISWRHGELDFGFDFAGLAIQLECLVTATSEANLRQRIRSIAEWIDPSYGERRLIFDTEPDKFYLARFAGSADVEIVARQGRVTLPFRASDPFAYAVQDDVFVYTAPGSYQFHRKGTAISYPKIEIEGTCNGGKIAITLNGKMINYTGTLAAGETLVFDSATITAYKITTAGTGIINVINDIDSIGFPFAAPGANNLAIDVSGGATVSKIAITCHSRWI